MASASSLGSFLPLSKPIKSNTRTRTRTRTYAARREAHNHDFSGRLVDENLIVLRRRIHEMKMMETEQELPSEWMDWEKQVYASYDPIICDAMGHLQSYLMEARPCLAIGTLALIALSVPTSTAVVLYNLLEFSRPLLSGIHLG